MRLAVVADTDAIPDRLAVRDGKAAVDRPLPAKRNPVVSRNRPARVPVRHVAIKPKAVAAADRVVVARVAPNRAIAGPVGAREARVEGSKAEDGASAEPVRVVRAARAVGEKVAGRVRIGRSAHPCSGWRLRFDFCRTD